MNAWDTVLGQKTMESINAIARDTANLPTLRDQFAMAALNAIGGTPCGLDVGNERLAKECYSMADAMLKVRENKGE